jgi:uncharacterized protein (DUF58 family)/transglutaminase-like putative cysteine protease
VGPTRIGWSALAAGVILYIAGAGLRYPELIIGGTGLLLLVAACSLWLIRRPLLNVERVVTSTRLRRGEPLTGRLQVTNVGAVRSPHVDVIDRLGQTLITINVPPLPPGGSHVSTYQLATPGRGLHTVGPLTVTQSDPFGLLARTQTVGEQTSVLVRPRTHWMTGHVNAGGLDVDGAAQASLPEGGISFQSLRPYTPGDDLRLIHWRTTARVGTLMVKRQVDHERPETLVVLDDRVASYRSVDTFEDAVEVAASAVEASAALDLPVRFVVVSGQRPGSAARSPDDALDLLATVQVAPANSAATVAAALDPLSRESRGESALVISGDRVGDDLNNQLGRLRGGYRKTAALIVSPFRAASVESTGPLRLLRAPTANELVALWNGGRPGPAPPGAAGNGRPAPAKTPSPAPSLGQPSALRAAAALVAVATAGLVFQRVFTLSDIVVPVVLGVALGGGAAFAVRLIVRRPDRQVLLIAAAVIAGASAAALRSTPRPAGFGAAINYGLTWMGGWDRILHTAVPVPPTPDRLPVVGACAALTAALAVQSATRPRPGLRPLVPAGILFVIGLALGARGPGSLIAVTLPFVAGSAVYLLSLTVHPPTGPAWEAPGRWAVAALTVLAVAAVTIGAGDRLPFAHTGNPFNVARLFHPTVDLSSAPNPLELPPSPGPPTVAFTASVNHGWLSAPSNWRLVSLDRFDGAHWTWSAAPVRVGTVLPRVGPSTGTPATASVIVANLAGPWVPTTGIPVAVQPAKLAYDPAATMLVDPPSVRGRRYQLAVRLPDPTSAELNGAGIEGGPATSALTKLPACVPPGLRTLANDATRGVVGAYDQARAVEKALTANYKIDSQATAGHGCEQLQAFLERKGGTAEQFAVSFTVMARSVGLPARLAVGFAPGSIDRSNGQVTVRSTDGAVWSEVQFTGVGWVPFNPQPGSHISAPSPPTPRPAQSASSGAVHQTAPAVTTTTSVPPATVPAAPSAVAPAPTRHHSHGPPGGWWALLAIVVALIAVQTLPRIGRARRRKQAARKGRADPAARVLGAWEEVLDDLADLDVAVNSMTPSEIGQATMELAPAASSIVRLAILVDALVYSAARVTEDDARLAWVAAGEVNRALRDAQPLTLRMRSAVLFSRA